MGQRVVTWQTPSGRTLDVAPACEARMTAAGTWPQAYCQVSHGLHYASGGCACPACYSPDADYAAEYGPAVQS
jgi:hypothetical protein